MISALSFTPNLRRSAYHRWIQPAHDAAAADPRLRVRYEVLINKTIQESSQEEQFVSVPPKSVLTAIGGVGDDLTKITFQILDIDTNRPLFSQFVTARTLLPLTATPEAATPVHRLVQPRLILAPGNLLVTVRNNDSVGQFIQLVLFLLEPR